MGLEIVFLSPDPALRGKLTEYGQKGLEYLKWLGRNYHNSYWTLFTDDYEVEKELIHSGVGKYDPTFTLLDGAITLSTGVWTHAHRLDYPKDFLVALENIYTRYGVTDKWKVGHDINTFHKERPPMCDIRIEGQIELDQRFMTYESAIIGLEAVYSKLQPCPVCGVFKYRVKVSYDRINEEVIIKNEEGTVIDKFIENRPDYNAVIIDELSLCAKEGKHEAAIKGSRVQN